jgi:hypothetical protein
MRLGNKADTRFFWNHYLCEKMMNGDHQDGTVPDVSENPTELNIDAFLNFLSL